MNVGDIRVFFEVKGGKHRTSVKAVKEEEQNKADIEYPCFLFLDQSTSTGYALYDNKSQLVLGGVIEKGKANLTDYKYKLKGILEELIDDYKVSNVFYEEVYDKENMWTTEVLMYIKHMVQDISYFKEDVEVLGVDHMVWKSKLAGKDKFNTSGNHKVEVKKYVEGVYPLLFIDKEYIDLTEHTVDAMGMGIGLMVKQTRRGNFYHTVRYKKNLPIEELIVAKGDKSWEEVIAKCRKPFRDAYELGGIMELELDRRRGIGDLFRRILTHRDGVACVKVPRDYKDWGVTLLLHNKSPEELTESKDFWLIAVRKRRKK